MTSEHQEEVMRAIGRIEGKIDGILEQAKATNGRVSAHDAQIASLCSFRDNMIGKVSVISVLFSFLGSAIVMVFKEILK